MGATGIEWTRGPNGEQGYTFNPWIGCTKLTGACQNCYAETASAKFGSPWGPHADRRGVADSTWDAPRAWNRRARRLRCRFRVFCASMADFLDNHRSIRLQWRSWLYETIFATPNLDWLLLTKRPENAEKFLPAEWFDVGKWPKNVWFGITTETQKDFNHRAKHLRGIPAPIRFLSVEPMLGPILLPPDAADFIDWVIIGGESGALSAIRDTDLAWMRALVAQCAELGIPVFVKQMPQISHRGIYKKFEQFAADLRIREQPVLKEAA